jgi:hypothetical protein
MGVSKINLWYKATVGEGGGEGRGEGLSFQCKTKQNQGQPSPDIQSQHTENNRHQAAFSKEQKTEDTA